MQFFNDTTREGAGLREFGLFFGSHKKNLRNFLSF